MNSRFTGKFGSSTFDCKVCLRTTRDTGQDHGNMCADCEWLTEQDNTCNDSGMSPEEVGNVAERDRRLKHIKKLGGDIELVKSYNPYLFPVVQS